MSLSLSSLGDQQQQTPDGAGGRKVGVSGRNGRDGSALPEAIGVLFKMRFTTGKACSECGPFPAAAVGAAAGRWQSRARSSAALGGGRGCPAGPWTSLLGHSRCPGQCNEIRSSEARLGLRAGASVLGFLGGCQCFFFPLV